MQPTSLQSIHAIVVAAGDLPPIAPYQELLHRCPTIVCDGALQSYYHATGMAPSVVIGDGDSVDRALLEQLSITLTHVADQETNDLTKAMTYARAQGWTSILILGLTGKRDDHTVANIFLLPSYLRMGLRVIAPTAHGTFVPFTGDLILELDRGTQISLFAPDGAPLSADGVAYPFRDRCFAELWEATLNEVTDCPAHFHTEGIALLYIAHETK